MGNSRIAIMSDIHGNLQALEAVLADASNRRARKIYCLGDVVGYGANPDGCIDLLMDSNIDIRCIRGNHDMAVVENMGGLNNLLNSFKEEAGESIIWTRKQLSPKHLDFLRTLPLFFDLGYALMYHSNIVYPEVFGLYIRTPRNLKEGAFIQLNFDRLQSGQILFVGHSHVPFKLAVNRNSGFCEINLDEIDFFLYQKAIFNVGSVGQPRDNDFRACYVIVDDRKKSVEYVRVEYDVEEAARRIIEAGLPKELAERLKFGK